MTSDARTSLLCVGIATLDLSYLVDYYPEEDTKNRAEDFFLGAGGPAANAAVSYAFLAGGGATLVTAIGQHPLSTVIKDDLQEHSVRIHDLIAEHAAPPPVSCITVARKNASRTIVSLDASRIPPLPADFPAALLSGAGAVLVDGHLLNPSIAMAKLAREAKVPVIFDCGRWQPGYEALLAHVDIAICSRSFRPPAAEDDTTRAAHEYLLARGVSFAATTDGAAPIVYSTKTETGEIVVPRTEALDTLGAGDIFHGAFCYFYTRKGFGFVQALRSAAEIAAISCQYFGTRAWMSALLPSLMTP